MTAQEVAMQVTIAMIEKNEFPKLTITDYDRFKERAKLAGECYGIIYDAVMDALKKH